MSDTPMVPNTSMGWRERVGCTCIADDGSHVCLRQDECMEAWHQDQERAKMQTCDVCEKTSTDVIVFRDGTAACTSCTIELLQAEIQEFREAARAVLDAGLVKSHPTLDRLRAAVELREETDEENA